METFKGAFHSLLPANVAHKHIPNALLQSCYGDYLKIAKTTCKALIECFDEQVHHRIRLSQAAPAAQKEAQPRVVDVGPSDAEVWALAKEMHKTWLAAVGKKQALPWLTALGLKISRVHEEKTRVKEAKHSARGKEDKAAQDKEGKKAGEKGKGQDGEEGKDQGGVEGDAAAPAADEGKGQGGEEDDAAAPAADEGKGQGGKKAAAGAALVESDVKVDMAGNRMSVGATVICYAQKNKEKFNEKKATVNRLNTKVAVLTMLEGPAKGENRKADYTTLKVMPCEAPVKKLFAAAPAPAASAPVLPAEASPTNPDKECTTMFGNLSMIG